MDVCLGLTLLTSYFTSGPSSLYLSPRATLHFVAFKRLEMLSSRVSECSLLVYDQHDDTSSHSTR